MRGVRHFVVDATKTHHDREGSIELLARFQNQEKANQFHKIVAVPEKYKDVAEEGDTLCIHFNVVVFDRRNGVEKKSPNHLQDNLYWVPDNMAHFVMKEDGTINFLQEKCLVEGKIGREEEVRPSGIILPDVRPDNKKKADTMNGVLYAKCDSMWDVEVGDKVCLEPYSDYTLKFPDGTERWLVDYSSVLYKYDD